MKVNQAYIDKLVEKAQQGNSKAFGEIYDTYFPKIYKYVYYKVSEEYVDDVVATVFIKSWTKLKKYRKTSHPFSSWLFRIAHNTVIDHYRTNKEFYELEERIADDNDALDPNALADQALNSERVHRALKKLDTNYREVIILKFMNDLSNKDIAKVLHTNEGNVRTLQFRALKKLRVMLEDQEREAERKRLEQDEGEKVGLLRRLFAKS